MHKQPYGWMLFLMALAAAVPIVTAAQRTRAPIPPPTRPYGELGGCPEEPSAYHACAIAKAKTYKPPRTGDGHPDFRGFWSRAGVFGTDNIEEHGPELGDP